ncbi:ABC transporter substrate-binding protein [Natronorubrum texcoconense]|uniref:Peptide/nickel transport system substrate-binding protein n=1 Tax=Natronorubrum texcoconense TaxID=1095776 RepID=A0A1G8UMP9_9EURY|nr:ABC transporter substrate-binding protein [Natronorubrum texcoconense]SDJ55186.1 peptide/nickel transport system substrate-binding protein [Natronorubrum texcoconense]
MTHDTNYHMNRRTALKTTLGATALAVAGCLSDEPETADFRIGGPWEPNRDPHDGGSSLRRLGITEALVAVDYEANPAPGLATDWERLDDRRWQFDLREGVTFHDGTSLDAAAAVESLRRTVDSSAFAAVPIETVEAVDESTVNVETETAFSPLPSHLSRNEAVLLSPDAIEADGSITDPISTGPFALESFRSGSEVRIVRHDDYYGETPSFESVRYEVVDDDQTRRMKLENGELEMARVLPNEMVDDLEAEDDIDVYTPEIPRIRFLTFDTTTEPFDDERVRRAVHYAVDRESITESILDGIDDPAVGPFSPTVTDWANPDLEDHSSDPDRARSLLSEAGWSADSNDVRSRDGEELAVEFVTFDARSLPLIGQTLQDQLADVGFDVDITTMEYSAMVDRVGQDAFDAYLTSWGTLWHPDPDRLSEMFHSTDATLHHGYENHRVDELLEEGRELTDRDERLERYHEVQSIVVDEAPIVVLTDYANVVATAAGVSGYEPHPTESRYGLESLEYDSE